MKQFQFLFVVLLIAGFMLSGAQALAQETATENQSAADEGDVEAGAAEAGEEAQEEEEENNRRRRAPLETKIDLGDEKAIRVTWIAWPVDGPDYPNLGDLAAGEVMMITASAPPKLWTHADLTFGDLVIKEGNVAENYPGVYGLWLRKTDDGWNLVFNNKPDVWGTMYDPAVDAGEVPLEYSKTELAVDSFTAELKETGENSGTLELTWGDHRWATPFTYGE